MNAVRIRALALSLLTVGAVGGMSGAAWATPSPPTPITIVNPSFEADTVPTGSSGPQDYYNVGSFTGWTLHGPYGGWFHPSTVEYPGGGNYSTAATGIPDGSQVAWLNDGASLTQQLGTAYGSNTAYSLSFYVGHRADAALPNSYSVELLAGSNVVASLTNPGSPASGSFSQYTLDFTSGFFDPRAGQLLGIALINSGSNVAQINFDYVTLTEVTNANVYVPEPASLGILLFAFSVVFAARRSGGRGFR